MANGEEKNVRTLTDEEIEEVIGGFSNSSYDKSSSILCPVCKKGKIKLGLHDFLYGNSFTCPCCNTNFHMDKDQCAPMLDKLQDLYSATKEVERLKKQAL